MVNKLPGDKYYTPKEVQDKLGITEPALRNLVRTNQLHRITPPGKKHSVFAKEEIDSFLSRWLAFLSTEEPEKMEFHMGTLEDQEEELLLTRYMFGPAAHDMETRKAWFAKNKEIDYIVRDDGKIVSFMNLLPAKHEAIMDFMDGKIRGWDIQAEDVEAFEPGKPIEVIVMGMATTPDAPPERRRMYSAALLRGMRDTMKSLGERGIEITKLYATSQTPSGIGILMHAGFHETGKRLGKRIAFVLDVQESELPIFNDYKTAFEHWKSSQAHPEKKRNNQKKN